MFCNKCGAEAVEGALFCRKCGNKLPVIDDLGIVVEPEEVEYVSTANLDNSINTESETVTPDMDVQGTVNDSYNEDFQDNVEDVNVSSDIQDSVDSEVIINAGTSSDYSDGSNTSSYFEDVPYDGVIRYEEEPKKEGKGKLIAIIAAAAVVVIAAIIVFVNTNTFHRIFTSPESYYKYVEKKNAKKVINDVTTAYGAYVIDILAENTLGSEQSVSFEISDDIISEIEDIARIDDLSFAKEIKLTSSSSLKDDISSGSYAISLGKNTVLTLNVVYDIDADLYYIQIPELSDDYIEFDMNNLPNYSSEIRDAKEASKAAYSFKDLSEALPRAAKATKMLTAYSDIVFDGIHDVEKEKDTLKADGISQKCYVLKVKLNKKDLKDIAKSIRKEALDDDELKELIISIAETMNEDGEAAYKDFTDSLYDLDVLVGTLDGTKMKVYVDNKGNIIGREFETPNDEELKYALTVKGREFGMEVSAGTGRNDIFALEGSGRKSGDKYTGDFTLDIEGDELDFTVDSFDAKSFRSLSPTCQISVKVEDILDYAGINSKEAEFISDYTLVYNVNNKSSRSSEMSLKLVDGKNEAAEIGYSGSIGAATKVSVPDSSIRVESASDLKHYLQDADFEGFNDNLRDAGIPGDMVDALEQIEEYVNYLDYLDFLNY